MPEAQILLQMLRKGLLLWAAFPRRLLHQLREEGRGEGVVDFEDDALGAVVGVVIVLVLPFHDGESAMGCSPCASGYSTIALNSASRASV